MLPDICPSSLWNGPFTCDTSSALRMGWPRLNFDGKVGAGLRGLGSSQQFQPRFDDFALHFQALLSHIPLQLVATQSLIGDTVLCVAV